MKNAIKVVSVSLLTMTMFAAHAEGVEVMRKPYQEAPTLPIAPANSVQGAMPGAFPFAAGGVPAMPAWEAAITDGSIRKVIEKWSATAGWTFGLEHWTVDRDLPVMAKGSFNGDFRNAIRGLLATTELTDLPLQPCFYSNSVLRIVPRAELCDRTAVSLR